MITPEKPHRDAAAPARREDAFERFFEAPEAVVARGHDDIVRTLRLMTDPEAAPALVFDGRSRVDARLRVFAVGDGGFTASVEGRPLQPVQPLQPGRTYGLVGAGTRAVAAFVANLRECRSGELRFDLPAAIAHGGFRRSARSVLTSAGGAEIAFAHPRVRRVVRATMREASGSGFSASLHGEESALFTGDRLSPIRIFLAGSVVRAAAVVRHVDAQSFGVELTDFECTAARHQWQGFAFRSTHPRVVHDHRPAWQVLESSGYVELWAGAQDRAALCAEHAAFWLEENASTGILFTVMDSARPVATMAANLLYPRTWMLHHLGVDRGVRADRTAFLSCVRELYSAALHGTEHVSEPEFLTLYVEADKGFTDFLYGNFARMYGRSGDLQWSHNYVFRADTRRDRPAAEPGDPAIRVATRDDLELLAASCARTRTPMEIRAHELDPEGLSAEGFARRLSPRRPVRARETYVFAAGGRATWAVVCETGSEGANVFGLLNRCWLAELSPRAGTDEPGARRALLRRAIRHFSDAGRRQVVLLAPDARWLADAEGAGFEFVSKGAVWLSRWAVTPAWLAYVHDALSLPRSAAWRAA